MVRQPIGRDFSENTPGVATFALAVGSLAGWLGHEASSKSKHTKALPITCRTDQYLYLRQMRRTLGAYFRLVSSLVGSGGAATRDTHKYIAHLADNTIAHPIILLLLSRNPLNYATRLTGDEEGCTAVRLIRVN